MKSIADNREAWLIEAVRELRPILKRADLECPPVLISCGFPSRGVTGVRRRVGECCSDGNHKHIFIHPSQDDELKVLEIVLHEMIHAALPPGVGHRKPFSRAARAVGLMGKPTATFASPELSKEFEAIRERLGPYPHKALNLSRKKAGSPLIKVMCMQCGYIIRVTGTWLSQGAPICPSCGIQMCEADVNDEPTTPLRTTEMMIEYSIPGDDRFVIRMVKQHRHVQWYVVDYGPPVIDGKAVLGPVIPRVTLGESREECLDMIDSLRAGLITYDDLEVEEEEVDDLVTDEDLIWEDEDEERNDFESYSEDDLAAWEREYNRSFARA